MVKKQEVKTGKKLSLLLFAGIVITLFTALLTEILPEFKSLLNMKISIIGILLAATLFLAERLLHILNRYLAGFAISPNFARNIRVARRSLLAMAVVFILFYFLYYALYPSNTGIITLYFVIWAAWGILAVCAIVFYIAFLLTGKCILNFCKTDRNERMKDVGSLMFYGAVFPLTWFFVPILTYRLFAEATRINMHKK